MPQTTPQQATEAALALHQAGRLADAQNAYEHLLRNDPDNVDVLHLLGVLSQTINDHARAIDLFEKAIALTTDSAAKAVLLFNLASVQRAARRSEHAIASLQSAVELEPEYADAHEALSAIFAKLGRHEQAMQSAQRALALDDESPAAHHLLAMALQALNQFDPAIASFRRAIALKPEYVEAINNLATLYTQKGEFAEAIELLGRAIELRPEFADAHCNLGTAIRKTGKLNEALPYFEKARELNPTSAEILSNLALIYRELNRLDEAHSVISEAIELHPDSPQAHFTFALIYESQNRPDEASLEYERTLALDPRHSELLGTLAAMRMKVGLLDDAMRRINQALAIRKSAAMHSNLCMAANYHPTLSGEEVLKIHRQWDEDYGTPALRRRIEFPPHRNDRTADRRLRIGYVSPDFMSHSVTAFIEPVLAKYDHQQFEVFCYSNVAKPDANTARLRGMVDHWREITYQADKVVDQQVREDKIDILVDLAGHTAYNRLTLFARKPAPVQVSMIGYPASTGLSAIDYKISDPHCDPESAQKFYSEKLLRLDDIFWCFRPTKTRDDIAELPARSNGFVTFGSVNIFSKVSDEVLDHWARAVAAVPNSRVHFQHDCLLSSVAMMRVYDAFDRHGVSDDRITLRPGTSFVEFTRVLQSFDIGLDPFPFNGGTTTCHLFYCGVPIVTLAGERQAGRMGATMLHAVGLPDLIASSKDEYIKKLVELANDVDRLAEIRASLRSRMLASPLCNARTYTASLERAYRSIWSIWCNQNS